MKRPRSGPIASSRRTVAVFIFPLIALLSGGAWFFLHQAGKLRATVEADLVAIAALKVDQISQWRAERLGDASVLSESRTVSRQLTAWLSDAGSPEGAALLSFLRSLQSHYGYSDVLITDVGGRTLFSISGPLHPLAQAARRTLAEAFAEKRASLSDLHEDPVTHVPHIDVIAPVFSGPGPSRPLGAILLHFEADSFLFPMIQTWPTASATAETLLVRRDGDDVLYLNDLRHRADTALKLRIPLTKDSVPAVMAVTGKTGIAYGVDYRGVSVVAALKQVPGTGWYLVAKEDTSEVFAQWRLSSTLIIAFLVGAAAAMAVAAGLVWQRSENQRYRALLQAQAERHESEERYRITLLSVGDGVISTDPGGIVRVMNPIAEALTGWTEEQAVGRPLEEIFNIIQEHGRAKAENPVRRVMKEGVVVGLADHTLLISRNGEERSIADSGAPIRDENGGIIGTVMVFRDVTEERRRLRERETTLELLDLLNGQARLHDLIRSITEVLQKAVGCEAVGVRLKEDDDFPYFETRGFPAEFVRLESSLCVRGPDGGVVRGPEGAPYLECMCGNVLSGRFDPSKPFFTPKGSFWTNGTTDLLAGTADSDRLTRTRNRCNSAGYESVALVPIKYRDSTFGLLQFNDREKNRFTPELIAFLEHVSDQIAIALDQRRTERALAKSEEHYRSLFENMLNGYAYCRMIFENGEPVDYVYIEVNRAFETLTGLKNAAGKRVSELIPGIRSLDPKLLEAYGRTVRTGVPEKFEIPVNSMNMWYSVSVYRPRAEHFVAIFDVITERKRAEAARQLLASAVDQAAEMILITDVKEAIQYVNPAFEAVTGYSRAEAVGRTPRILKSGGHGAEFFKELWAALGAGKSWKGRITNRRKDGTPFIADTSISPVIDADGTVVNYVASMRDVSRELLLEDQLLQAQKMESVGRLAGGVAHDFNNMLHVIGNYVELALKETQTASSLHGHLLQIQAAAQRSAELTRQLLAFARKQTISPRVIDLNEAIPGMMKMLQSLIGEDIDLSWKPGGAEAAVKMDPVQLNQVLANLAVNARDAIAGVGRITIETGKVKLDEAYCAQHAGYAPGDYVLLAVSDDGRGMDGETMAHLFEPFYTTKPVGKGTGLGLATVYGIVRQNNGFINVYSEPAHGTTVKLYFPCVGAEGIPAKAEDERPVPRRGEETVLVVEDEEAILALSRTMLTGLGYTALTARTPDEAIRLAREHAGTIHLVVTDVVMPGMNGRDLVEQLRRIKPGMKYLYMSGYTADVIAHQGVLEEGVQFIPKPFTMDGFSEKIREALER